MKLNNLKKIKKLDKGNVLGSIEQLPKQIGQAWKESSKIKPPDSYKKVKNIVLLGMGGSVLGAHIIKALNLVKVPFCFFSGYETELPSYVGKDTLCIISSYSGNTEEPLSALSLARRKKAKILGITAGGKLKAYLLKNQLPGYIFSPKYNPSGQPRMALGYSVVGLLGMLKRCGLVKINGKEVQNSLRMLERLNKIWGTKIKFKNNEAKKAACALNGFIPILAGSEFLVGNLHAFANQLNESSKNFSAYFSLPELNHHLMEGLKYPKKNRKLLKFLFIESPLYHPRTKVRYKITKDVILKNGLKVLEYHTKPKTKISQMFEVLLFGSYVSFYLAMLSGEDPSKIPWVDYFKEKLG